MTKTSKPSKQAVREYLERRTLNPLEPPPSLEEIRRQMGWHLEPHSAPVREEPD